VSSSLPDSDCAHDCRGDDRLHRRWAMGTHCPARRGARAPRRAWPSSRRCSPGRPSWQTWCGRRRGRRSRTMRRTGQPAASGSDLDEVGVLGEAGGPLTGQGGELLPATSRVSGLSHTTDPWPDLDVTQAPAGSADPRSRRDDPRPRPRRHPLPAPGARGPPDRRGRTRHPPSSPWLRARLDGKVTMAIARSMSKERILICATCTAIPSSSTPTIRRCSCAR
jgi:hypothetical protein